MWYNTPCFGFVKQVLLIFFIYSKIHFKQSTRDGYKCYLLFLLGSHYILKPWGMKITLLFSEHQFIISMFFITMFYCITSMVLSMKWVYIPIWNVSIDNPFTRALGSICVAWYLYGKHNFYGFFNLYSHWFVYGDLNLFRKRVNPLWG